MTTLDHPPTEPETRIHDRPPLVDPQCRAHGRSQSDALRRGRQCPPRAAAHGVPRHAAVLRGTARGLLVALVGFLRRQGGDARQPRARRWRQDAGRPLLSRRPAELCREPARQVGRQRRAGLPRRRQGRAPHELAGAERPRRADASGAGRRRDRPRRPRLRGGSQHAGIHRELSGGRVAWRHLVLLFARLRRARHPRPLRPDRAPAADHLRCLSTMPARPSAWRTRSAMC